MGVEDRAPSEDRKRKARKLANLAQTYGFLIPEPCNGCGGKADHKHHEDYNKPLEVTWLCRFCHFDLHSSERGSDVDEVIKVLERFLAKP